MNETAIKNQLIFDYASGKLGLSKSIFASTYLYLNAKAANLNQAVENILGDNLLKYKDTPTKNLKYSDCLSNTSVSSIKTDKYLDPVTKLLGPLGEIKWKQVYNSEKIISQLLSKRNF